MSVYTKKMLCLLINKLIKRYHYYYLLLLYNLSIIYSNHYYYVILISLVNIRKQNTQISCSCVDPKPIDSKNKYFNKKVDESDKFFS